MEEIALSFQLELQELLDRYKNRLSVTNIMRIAQDIFHKTLSIRHHSEIINYFLQSTEYNKSDLEGEFKCID